MSPPQRLRQRTSNCSSLLIYRPRKDERLSWPSWLTYSGWLTLVSGHPSATSPRGTAKAHRPKINDLPLDHATKERKANQPRPTAEFTSVSPKDAVIYLYAYNSMVSPDFRSKLKLGGRRSLHVRSVAANLRESSAAAGTGRPWLSDSRKVSKPSNPNTAG